MFQPFQPVLALFNISMSLLSLFFNTLLGKHSAGGQEKASQYLGEVPQAIRSAACGLTDIRQYKTTEGKIRSFPLPTISVTHLENHTGQHCITESRRAKLSWGLVSSAQGFRDQCSQGDPFLKYIFERYKQGRLNIYLPMGNNLYFHLQ